MTTFLRVAPPVRPAAPVCEACKAFAPECIAPVGDGAAELCWLCAHHASEHGRPLEECAAAECECERGEVYPPDVLAKLPAPAADLSAPDVGPFVRIARGEGIVTCGRCGARWQGDRRCACAGASLTRYGFGR